MSQLSAVASLSRVTDSQKFSEIIDQMSVPTVSVYRRDKEKPFRRPTQNPRPRSAHHSKAALSLNERRGAATEIRPVLQEEANKWTPSN